MTEVRRNARPICGARREIGREPYATCFRGPHGSGTHVSEDGTSWEGCQRTRYGESSGSSIQIVPCMLPKDHDGDHEDAGRVRWMNDRYWEPVEFEDVQQGDILRDQQFGEPFVVFSKTNGWLHYSGGSTSGGGHYRLVCKGYHGRIETIKVSEAYPKVTLALLIRLFWKWIRRR